MAVVMPFCIEKYDYLITDHIIITFGRQNSIYEI